MPRQRSPNRDKAFEIYKEHGGNIENRQIAKILNISEKTVSGWKCKDKWEDKLNGVLQTNTEYSKRKKGGQPQNKNAEGHGAPAWNKNAESHGFFSKYLPKETLEIMDQVEKRDPIDIIWDMIKIKYAAIIRSQGLMYVKNQEDLTKVLKREKESSGETSESWEKEYELQFPWDKQATFLNAESRAMAELRSLIKQHDEMLHNNWDMATEEQKLRVEKLRVEIEKVKNHDDNNPIEVMIKRKSDK